MRQPLRRFNVVELYAGTARSAEAFRHWRRATIGLLVDNDPLAYLTYLHNHPGAPYWPGNLSSMTPADVAAYAGGSVEILVGCPPCQGFSDTGARDMDDPRNSHLARFAFFAEALRPLAIAMENVPIAAGTRRFARFVGRLERCGYQCTWGVVNAALHGSTQCRHRLIFIGIRGDVGATPVLPAPSHGARGRYYSYHAHKLLPLADDRVSLLREGPGVRRVRVAAPHREELQPFGTSQIPTLAEAWRGLPRLGSAAADRVAHFQWSHTPAMRRRMARVPEGGRWSGGDDHFSHSYGRLHRCSLAPTVTTFFANAGSGRYWHPTENRAISLREAARLQGFPDSFAFAPSWASCRLVGNALDAALANVTYQVIRSCLS